MHINVEPGDDHVVLHIRGEFDTFYCHLEEEIAAIQKNGIHQAVLNLRLVKFINSTALGAIIKASKALGKEGGKLVIARPSAFCRDIIEKVGLDRRAGRRQRRGRDPHAQGGPRPGGAERSGDRGTGSSSVIFRLVDSERLRHFVEQAAAKNPLHGHAFGENWAGIGRMSGLDGDGLRFTWNGAARRTSRPSTWARCSLWARSSS